jgi:DNA-binding CsgD family transcriptional regulator
MLGPVLDASRPGSIWFRSMVDEFSSDLSDFHAMRSMRELAVVPLESGDRFTDAVEFHFTDKLRNHHHLLLNSLAPVVSSTWRGRSKGLFTESILQKSGARREAEIQAPILSPENPARLSRSEYRVGLMLSHGLQIGEVKSSLKIQESTLRTHLSSLYAKTHATGLSELVYLLVSSRNAAYPMARTGERAK